LGVVNAIVISHLGIAGDRLIDRGRVAVGLKHIYLVFGMVKPYTREALPIRVANVENGLPVTSDAKVARQLHRERELVVLERVDCGHLVTAGSDDGASYV